MRIEPGGPVRHYRDGLLHPVRKGRVKDLRFSGSKKSCPVFRRVTTSSYACGAPAQLRARAGGRCCDAAMLQRGQRGQWGQWGQSRGTAGKLE